MTKKKTTSQEKLESKTSKTVSLKPRITEKASLQSNANAYTFVVDKDTTKLTLKNKIKKEHNVTPIKINITNLPSKRVVVRNNKGVKSGIKKAIVFLKKGDTIKL
jgi:large subunit ribosomal protein L23